MFALNLTVGCAPDEPQAEYLHEDLEPFFTSFTQEAALRGITFDWKEAQIEGYISDLSDESILGQCVHDNLEPDRIIIDQSFWFNSSYYDKEFIIFHELGHCFLGRSHLDDVDDRGICISIMNSGSARCRSNYSENTREQYLDELFEL